MNDSTLLKISLVIALVGILLLYFVSESIEIDNVELIHISDYKDKTIKLEGIVEEATTTESATFLKVKQYELIDIVVFDSINVSSGNYIEVIGTVDEYNNKYEILAEKIKVR